MDDLPLMDDLPRGRFPRPLPLVLASGSPRRQQLMQAAGYDFRVELPDDDAEDQPRDGETPAEAVCRQALQKAANVARRGQPAVIIAADTLGVVGDTLLGKPADRDDAHRMLRALSGRQHQVITGICLWEVPTGRHLVEAVVTTLQMQSLDEATICGYLDSGRWQGKAAGFGYQDGNDWLAVVQGSDSNVVGLPMERLAQLLTNFDDRSAAAPR